MPLERYGYLINEQFGELAAPSIAAPIAGGGLEENAGQLQREALTGDVTAAAGSNATTIANDAVTNAKLANMAEATFKMRAAGAGAGDPIDGTAAQAKSALALTAADLGDFSEAVDDRVAALATAGAGLSISYNDGAGTLTFAISDAELTSIAGLTSAADRVPYYTGSGTAALATFTSVARTLVAQSTQADMRTTGLGLGTAAVKNTGTSGDAVPVLNGAATTWAAGATFGGVLSGTAVTSTSTVVQAATSLRGAGYTAPSSGTWFSLGVSGGRALAQGFDHTGAAYVGMDFAAADFTFNAAIRLNSYTIATLPASSDGALAFASNGRKTGEGAGAGTGIPVYRDGGNWYRFADDSVAAA